MYGYMYRLQLMTRVGCSLAFEGAGHVWHTCTTDGNIHNIEDVHIIHTIQYYTCIIYAILGEYMCELRNNTSIFSEKPLQLPKKLFRISKLANTMPTSGFANYY